jgi:hypothetical protein
MHCTQGSAFYLGGSALVIWGWAIIGLCLEAYGFFLLFCEFFPTALQFFRRVPMLGKLLDLPVVKMVGSARLPPPPPPALRAGGPAARQAAGGSGC